MAVDVQTDFPVSIRRTESNTPQAVGVITAGALVESYSVSYRDSRRKTGYQRPVSTTRVNKLVNELRTGQVDIPTAVLLNIRGKPGDVLIDVEGTRGTLRPSGHELFVVDGQHRIEALAKLVAENPDKWSSYTVPFVCMLGAGEIEEMTQFYVVNSTAKSVRTDLALDLLKQRAEADPELMASLVEKGENWKVEGQTITEALSQSRLWKGRIRFPGEPKAETTIGSAGMVGSLKQLLATPYFEAISTDNRIKILDAYWEGIERAIPEAFKEPSDYAIQKSTGVMILHALLISVLELLRSQGRSVIEAESFENVVGPALAKLEGDTAHGDIARGPDFWLSGVHGAAGSFSSNAGRRVLRSRLRAELPSVEVE
jgi:DGQHR domain-containing protein